MPIDESNITPNTLILVVPHNQILRAAHTITAKIRLEDRYHLRTTLPRL